MKPPAPVVLRRGAVVRVAGNHPVHAFEQPAYAVSYVDLRFADGRVERWLGPGALLDDPQHLEHRSSPLEWGEEVSSEQGPSLAAEMGMCFTGVHLASIEAAPTDRREVKRRNPGALTRKFGASRARPVGGSVAPASEWIGRSVPTGLWRSDANLRHADYDSPLVWPCGLLCGSRGHARGHICQ